MKKINLAILLLFCSLTLILSGCAKQDTQSSTDISSTYNTISTEDLSKKLADDTWVVVDTRINDAYNGWALDNISRGGHIEGAVDFSGNWLTIDKEDKDAILDQALTDKGISSDKNIVLYDTTGNDAPKVADYLSSKGFENLYLYDLNQWADDESLPMTKLSGYQYIVPAVVVKDILDGKTPETFEEGVSVKMVEASWGEETESYLKGHIPTAIHINTDSIEPPPTWMLANDDALLSVMLEKGISANDTIIVSGADQLAAYRVALVLRYAGVKDVRVLNGGVNSYVAAGYELATDSVTPTPITDFGTIFPGNPDIIDTIPEVQELLGTDDFTLVDNRTWEEYIGNESGYSYHDKTGRIEGAKFGYAGKTDSSSLDYYRNIDGTMRNPKEILKMWQSENIDPNTHMSFMCGSGWRAAEVLYYANVAGYENVSMYSDGWIGWSNAELPSITGEP